MGSRIGFYVDKGESVVGLGNPTGPSEWIFSDTRSPVPYKGERRQLTPDIINDLTALASTINQRPHSDLRIHKAHP